MHRFLFSLRRTVWGLLAGGLLLFLSVKPASAVETLPVYLAYDAGSTITRTVSVSNRAGHLISLWSDNTFSTATLFLRMPHFPHAPVLHTATLPSTQTAWLSPHVPLPNAFSLQAVFHDTPTSAGRLGILMLLERP